MRESYLFPVYEDILSYIQLFIQVLTLSDKTVLNDKFRNPNNASKAVDLYRTHDFIDHYLKRNLDMLYKEIL